MEWKSEAEKLGGGKDAKLHDKGENTKGKAKRKSGKKDFRGELEEGRGKFFGAVMLEEIKDNTRNGRKLEGWEKER